MQISQVSQARYRQLLKRYETELAMLKAPFKNSDKLLCCEQVLKDKALKNLGKDAQWFSRERKARKAAYSWQ